MNPQEALQGLTEALASIERILKADCLSGQHESSLLALINTGFELCQTLADRAPELRPEAELIHRHYWFAAGDLERRSPSHQYCGRLGGNQLTRRPILTLCQPP